MADHVVDTNVLLVASVVEPYSPFKDSHVPLEQQQVVFDWLSAFRSDSAKRLVLDEDFRIYDEYRHQLTDQDFGLQVIHEKFNTLRTVALTWDAHGHAEVPESLQACDRSDRKFLAAALCDTATISIVNAADTDWIKLGTALAGSGVEVVEIIGTWLRESMSGNDV